jgi:hypothetical protein
VAACNDHEYFVSIKSPKVEFTYCNIAPLLHLPTKVFIDLTDMEPLSVAFAFFDAMYAFDESLDMAQDTTDFDPLLQDNSLIEEADDEATNTVTDPTGPTKNTYIMVSFKSPRLKGAKDQPRFYKTFYTSFNSAIYVPKGK